MDYQESACLVFFGIRYLANAEFDEDKDPRARIATAQKLDVWSGQRYPPVDSGDPGYFLLVGERLADVGYDGVCEQSVSVSELRKAITSVPKQLRKAGLTEKPNLWVQCRFAGSADWSHCWYTAFFGLRWVHSEDSEWEDDPRVLAAQKRKLNDWSLRCRRGVEDYDDDIDEDNLWVLVGKRLALVGDGKKDSARISAATLLKHLEATTTRLKQAGLRAKPALWAHCDIDFGE